MAKSKKTEKAAKPTKAAKPDVMVSSTNDIPPRKLVTIISNGKGRLRKGKRQFIWKIAKVFIQKGFATLETNS